MSDVVEDAPAPSGQRQAPSEKPARSVGRGSADEFIEGDGYKAVDTGAENDVDAVYEGPARRKLSDAQLAYLKSLDAGAAEDNPDPIDDPTPGAAAEAESADAAPAETKANEAKPEDAKPEPPKPDADAEARHDRLLKRNQELLAELDGYRKRGGRPEPSEREKALDEAERGYLDDSVTSARKLIASAIGAAIDSKDVDEEMLHFYNDLTEKLFSVDLDPNKKAIRQAARTKHMLARDKRERAAEKTQTDNAPSGAPPEEAISFVGSQLSKHTAKFPLLLAHAEDLDGMKPSHLLFAEIGKRINAGEFDAKAPGEQLVEMAAQKIEARYKALADKLGKATTQSQNNTSTATPTNAQDAKASPTQGADQKPGVRSVTNAQASAAPATPPAKKEVTTTEEPRKFRSEAERRRYLAQKHLGN